MRGWLLFALVVVLGCVDPAGVTAPVEQRTPERDAPAPPSSPRIPDEHETGRDSELDSPLNAIWYEYDDWGYTEAPGGVTATLDYSRDWGRGFTIGTPAATSTSGAVARAGGSDLARQSAMARAGLRPK